MRAGKSSQLPSTGYCHVLFGLLLGSLLELGLLLARPIEGLESLGEDGMRVVIARVEEVGIHGREILDLQLYQGLRELGLVAKVEGEFVW